MTSLPEIMNNSEFKKNYDRLNLKQKEAVDAIDGPVMVVAGPGTGKTQILTLRIANILKETDTPPENILALTFTESGVASMRRRLSDIIGGPAYSVVISTFHGFCNDVIKNYPEYFPRIIGSQNITEVDQIKIIEEAIMDLPLKELKPFGDVLYYLRSILSAINNLKREGVDTEQFKKIVSNELLSFNAIEDLYHEKGPHKGKMKGDYQKLLKQINKNQELILVYDFYQEQLEKSKLYDYSDMIMEVLKELQNNKDLLLILQEQHQYLLVDEHQDTNNGQNKIMELLCNFHPNPNIFVVGDEKQAIFRFQGASLENFMYFKKLYSKAKFIVLEDNYRSTQNILDSAHSVLPDKKTLKAQAPHNTTDGGDKIRLCVFSKPEAETYFLAKDIKTKIEKGVKPHEIAVLYRDNRDAMPLARMFEKVGLSFAIESDQDVLSDNDIKKLILLLRTVNEFGAQEKLIELMHVDFLGIQPLDVYRVVDYANRNKISLYSIIKSFEILSSLGLDAPEKMTALYENLSLWAIASKNENLPVFIEKIIRESGILAYFLNSKNATDKMDKLNDLFDEVQSLTEKHRDYRLNDFMDYIDTLNEHQVLIKKNNISQSIGQVRLMTAHRSKGQEFEYVYIINSFDGHWGNKRKPNLLSLPASVYSVSGTFVGKEDVIEDERRLFYVALTRAKKEVLISYSTQSLSGKEQLPCQFIQEIKPEFLEVINIQDSEDDLNRNRDILFAPPLVSGPEIKDKDFIRELFVKRGLAVTALNNYLKCPWQYFYTNLLRIPMAKANHQLYGTAIHESLKDYFEALTADRPFPPDKNYILERFKFNLSQQPFSERDALDWQERGLKALSGYYDFSLKDWRGRAVLEFNVGEIMLTPEIKLTGKIDKLEFVGNGHDVNVVDYKTGKPKTRGEIEGATKSSDGDIKRQLVFYNLLLDRYEQGPPSHGFGLAMPNGSAMASEASKKYKMVSGEIDFVEPDDKGRYKKEAFFIKKEDVMELEELIKKTGEEIMALAFWDKTCEQKDCRFCSLRLMMS